MHSFKKSILKNVRIPFLFSVLCVVWGTRWVTAQFLFSFYQTRSVGREEVWWGSFICQACKSPSLTSCSFPHSLSWCEVGVEGTVNGGYWRRSPGFAVITVPNCSPEPWAVCLGEEGREALFHQPGSLCSGNIFLELCRSVIAVIQNPQGKGRGPSTHS